MATSSNFDAAHEQCRLKVCVVCYGKAARKLSPTEVTNVKDFIIDGFKISNSNYPSGVCVSSHILLSKRRNNKNFVLSMKNIGYEPRRPTALRSVQNCTCRICEVA